MFRLLESAYCLFTVVELLISLIADGLFSYFICIIAYYHMKTSKAGRRSRFPARLRFPKYNAFVYGGSVFGDRVVEI